MSITNCNKRNTNQRNIAPWKFLYSQPLNKYFIRDRGYHRVRLQTAARLSKYIWGDFYVFWYQNVCFSVMISKFNYKLFLINGFTLFNTKILNSPIILILS